VYGTDIYSSLAFFLPRAEAERRAKYRRALFSRTWGEVRAAMAALGEDIGDWFDPEDDFDPPADEEPFSRHNCPGFIDDFGFDFHLVPMAMAMAAEWDPEVLGEDLCEVDDAYDRLYIEADDIDKVAERLRAQGYSLVRDDELLRMGDPE
jgi:hypothetical protein